jgi:hypothetical protein
MKMRYMMDTPLVERLILDDIFVYRFYQNNRAAVDAYLLLVDADIQAHLDTEPVNASMYYVIDVSRSGMFSVNYMRQRVNTIVGKKPRVPTSYIAYVTDAPNDEILVNLINALTARQLEHTRKIFPSEQFDEAIAWLARLREQEDSEQNEIYTAKDDES